MAGWIEATGQSAAEVAAAAGVSASTVHRILHDKVDPSIRTLREIALACNVHITLQGGPLSDPHAAAAARVLLEDGYETPPVGPVTKWQERLLRTGTLDDPTGIVEVAARASNPLHRQGALLYRGQLPPLRLASVGDATGGRWALSGAAGLLLSTDTPQGAGATIVWCENVAPARHLMTESPARRVSATELASIAIIEAAPALFTGSFRHESVLYAAPIQIMLDCIGQGGTIAELARQEMSTW